MEASHLEADTLRFDTANLKLSVETSPGVAVKSVSLDYGGMPLLADLYSERRSRVQNPVKIHAGDAITGTLYYTLFTGRADAALMNHICFDVFILGNHEFDDGDDGLAAFLDALNAGACGTPTLAANVVPGDSSPLKTGYLAPTHVKEVGGERIGFIGIDIAQKTKRSSRPFADTVFLDEAETAQKYIDALRADRIDKIVLVTHLGYENDLDLAAKLSGADVIVGGDSHSLLGGPNLQRLGLGPVGAYPTQVKGRDGRPVCVVQAWEYAHLLGELSVRFDAEGVVTGCAGLPRLPVDLATLSYDVSEGESTTERALPAADVDKVKAALAAYPEVVFATPDPDAAATLASYQGEVATLTQQTIADVQETLCLDRFPGKRRVAGCRTSVRGSDISNIVAKAFLTVTPTADIALQNAGGVRESVPAGDFTIAKAFSLLPFSNTLVTLEMKGSQIVQVLEDALSNHLDQGGSDGSYPYASGLRFSVDASAARGGRITQVEVNPRLAGSWAAIDPSRTYVVVTNDFIAGGRDGYDTLAAMPATDTYTEYAQGLIDYVKAVGTLRKLPVEEYSTQRYVGRDGCLHTEAATCSGY